MKRVFRQWRKVNAGLFQEFGGTHEGKRVQTERGGVFVVKLGVSALLFFFSAAIFLLIFPLRGEGEGCASECRAALKAVKTVSSDGKNRLKDSSGS